MADEFYFASDSDTGTKLFDCLDATLATNAYLKSGLQDFDSGANAVDTTLIQPLTVPGVLLVRKNYPPVPMSMRLKLDATSMTNWFTGAGQLSTLLQRDDLLLVRKFTGETERRYYDIVSVTIPALISGGAQELYWQMSKFTVPLGLTFQMLRQPFVIRDTFDPAVNQASNSTLLFRAPGASYPAGWSMSSTTNVTAPDVNSNLNAFEQVVATSSTRDLQQQTAAGTPAVNDVWSFSFDAQSPDTNAKVRAVITYQDSGGSTVGSAQTGTLITLTSSWQRITVTTSAAPASTSRILAAVRYENPDGTARTTRVRYAQLEKASATSTFRVGSQPVGNDQANSTTLGRACYFYNAGAAPAPVIVDVTGDSGASIVATKVGLRSTLGADGKRNLTDYVDTRKFLSLSTGSLDVDATTSADSGAAEGNRLDVDFSTASGMSRRVRLSISTNVDALKGNFEVLLRWRPSNLTTAFKAELHYSPSTTDPSTISLAPVVLDATSAGSSSSFVDTSLGNIQIPTDIPVSAANFELWVSRTTGSGQLYADTLTFVPADEMIGRMVMSAAASSVTFDSDELTGTVDAGLYTVAGDPSFTSMSTNSSGEYYTSTANQIVRTIPITLTGGKLVFTVGYSIQGTGGGDPSFTVVFRVVKSGAPNTVVASYTKTVSNQNQGSGAANINASLGAGSYEIQSYISAFTSGKLVYKYMSYSITPSVAVGDHMRSDPTLYLASKLDGAGNMITPLSVEGQMPFWAPPGLSAVYLHFGENRITGLDGDNTTLGRTPTVNFYYSPRDYV